MPPFGGIFIDRMEPEEDRCSGGRQEALQGEQRRTELDKDRCGGGRQEALQPGRGAPV